ncbi:MAG TPA: GTP-binding protein [Gemmataceae bacterium]|nr:GTP-binding protein [Gemmataceae bacterium]
MDEALLRAFREGDRRALSRLLTLAARGRGDEFLTRLRPSQKTSRVVTFTGSVGVGKSTLVGKLVELVRSRGQTVAVLACDPQSPLTGGALLGDRFRMPARPDDDGTFIRSLAAAPGHGALAAHLPAMVRLLAAFGFDVVLIETVGAGQGDTAARALADVLVLLLQPETGDDLQWEKAGVVEVADVVAIHKADLAGADSAAAQVRAALDLAGGSSVPVVKVSAKTGEGVAALWDAIAEVPARPPVCPKDGRDLLELAQAEIAKRYERAATDPRMAELLEAWRRGGVDSAAAASGLLGLLSELAE